MKKIISLIFLCLLGAIGVQAQQVIRGGLEAVNKDGKSVGLCPLKHTDVKTEISGFLARVKVTQEFENNFSDKIEAVYTFPLPQNAAVDDMTMRIGERVVRGRILKREEAKEVYEAAKSNGQIASLLDQERPNIFTQSVANILPNEKVVIEISYVETLKYEDGQYEFVFPMTVGPRYIPGSVTDANKISPPVAATRAGHDISIEVKLDAGVPIENIASKSHEIESTMLSANSSVVKLKDQNTIPNKDFILRYDVSGKRIEDAVLVHRDEKGGYFTLILQPPDKVNAQEVTPKEIVFVLDTSGSMEGFPIEKAKEAMKLAIDGLNPQDTFNLITFAGDTSILFDKPVPATPGNLKKAQEFLESRKGGGGTEMMAAIRAALDPSDSQQHVRVVCFMTDGYIGNEAEIISEVQKHPNARVFSFGIGSSVNRFLLDKMAEEGRGEAEYVSLNDDGSVAAKRFHERVRNPLLTDISVDFGNLQVADVYPKRINDLFSAKPLIIHGRFTKAGTGVIKLKGKSFGREVVREIPVNFPENEANHDVLSTLWARTRIDDLTSQDYTNNKPEIKDAIMNLGIEYRLMTQFTSFVAVEERIVTDGGQPRKIEVPVELPEGVSRKGIFGDDADEPETGVTMNRPTIQSIPTPSRKVKANGQMGAGQGNTSPTVNIMAEKTLTKNPKDSKVGIDDGRKRGETLFVVDAREETDYRSDAVKEDSSAALNGKAIKLPKPIVPVGKWDGSDGLVNVKVTVNEAGDVVSAAAESGNQLLRETSEKAAKTAKFKIDQPLGKPVQVTGIIAYSFTRENKRTEVSIELSAFAVKLSPEEQKQREISAKTSLVVFKLIQRLKDNKIELSDEETKFVSNGKAEIIVRLKELKPETIEELKKLGFEVLTEMASARAVVGRIAVEKIASLTEIDAVTFISPQNR